MEDFTGPKWNGKKKMNKTSQGKKHEVDAVWGGDFVTDALNTRFHSCQITNLFGQWEPLKCKWKFKFQKTKKLTMYFTW
jgi:hypothetical protein